MRERGLPLTNKPLWSLKTEVKLETWKARNRGTGSKELGKQGTEEREVKNLESKKTWKLGKQGTEEREVKKSSRKAS